MYATLGTIEFQLHTSPTAESDDLEIIWAGHEIINQPTKLQPTGRSLVTKEIEMLLHQSFCKVDEQVKKITDAATNYDAMALLYGNGKLEGDFVITAISKKTEQRDDLGNLISVTLTVTLKEFIADKLQTEQDKANKDAFATGDKKGVTNKKKDPPKACKNHVSDYAGKLQSYQVQEGNDYRKFTTSTDPSVKAGANFSVRNSVAAVKKLSESVKAAHADCLTQYQISTLVSTLITNCDALTAAMLASLAANTSAQASAHLNFQNNISQLRNLAHVANVQSITRKP